MPAMTPLETLAKWASEIAAADVPAAQHRRARLRVLDTLGLIAAAAAGEVDPDALVVAVLTGNGLKDPHTAEDGLDVKVIEAAPTIGGVAHALGWT